MKTIWDLRNHHDFGLFRSANENLERWRSEYFRRFGRVGTETWWQHLEAGRISITTLVGEIVHIGPQVDLFGEESDIVLIETDRQSLEYERDEDWKDPIVRPGNWVQIDRVKVCVTTPTGPITTILDVRIQVGSSPQSFGTLQGPKSRDAAAYSTAKGAPT